MKRTCTLFLLALATMCFAQERSAEEAANIAAQFLNEQANSSPARKATCTASSLKLSHTRAKLNSEVPAFYVFNKGDEEGFVVVSADDRTEDVLMYSDKGELDVENANPGLRFWLNRLQEEITVANDENAVDKSPARRAEKVVTPIAPLLINLKGEEITWSQDAPYNDSCPMDQWVTSERCLTGCVATGAAQIMYKWNYPQKGTRSKTYTWKECDAYNDYGECAGTQKTLTLTKDFSKVTFDWNNMLPAYLWKAATDAQKSAVAELMYSCGVAAEMTYGSEHSALQGSATSTDYMGNGLKNYFGYKVEKYIIMGNWGSSFSPYKNKVTVNEFEEYFNADLEKGRPILMGGEGAAGGHEFICDGRDNRGYFHINWGWEGGGNCYCLLSALTPNKEEWKSYTFSSNLDALIGIEPKNPVMDTLITKANNSEYGTTSGDTIVMLSTRVQITAQANEGYHFTKWSDNNTDNPRNIILYQDSTLEAIFEADSPTNLYNQWNKSTTPQVTKILKDGQLFIFRDGKVYNALGAKKE